MENVKLTNKAVMEGATLVTVKAMLEKVDIALTASGKKYLNLFFRDKTGEMVVKQWDAGEEEKKVYQVGKVYSLEGLSTNVFNGSASYTLKKGARVVLLETENPSDYCNDIVPETEYLKKVIRKYMNEISGNFKTIILKAFNEELEQPDDFFIWPAAESMHHNKAGGLAFHTATMLQLADAICNVYSSHYKVNRELVLTATLLHDFFKTKEYTLNEDGTGQLTDAALEGGHIILCCDFYHDCEKEGLITREQSKMLRHLVLSHHGEFGPVLPSTLEASILHYVDMIDSRSYMFESKILELEPGEMAAKKDFGTGARIYNTTLKPE